MPQDYRVYTVRDAAIVTNSYVAGTVIEDVHMFNQLVILPDITVGSLTSAEIRVRYSHDNTNWYQLGFLSISGSTATVSEGEFSYTADSTATIELPIKYRHIEIAVKGTGTVTSSSVAITAIVGNH